MQVSFSSPLELSYSVDFWYPSWHLLSQRGAFAKDAAWRRWGPSIFERGLSRLAQALLDTSIANLRFLLYSLSHWRQIIWYPWWGPVQLLQVTWVLWLWFISYISEQLFLKVINYLLSCCRFGQSFWSHHLFVPMLFLHWHSALMWFRTWDPP
jgi:hypothetical protein